MAVDPKKLAQFHAWRKTPKAAELRKVFHAQKKAADKEKKTKP